MRHYAGMDPVIRRWWRLLDDLPGRLHTVHRWLDRRPPAREDDGHLHVTPTTVVCLEGVLRVISPGRSIDLKPGEGLVIAAGVWHRHELLRPGSITFGQGFLPTCSDVLLGDHQRSWSGRLPFQPSSRLMMATQAEDDGPRRVARCVELVKQVLDESIDDLRFADPALKRMVDRLWSNLHRGVTVPDLVRASGLSRAQAYRVFAAGYGIPPKTAIATARLWLAEALLASGQSVADVAERCGFPSPDTFARAWKREHGTPPSRARKEK